jgi:hypothetical protein
MWEAVIWCPAISDLPENGCLTRARSSCAWAPGCVEALIRMGDSTSTLVVLGNGDSGRLRKPARGRKAEYPGPSIGVR